MRNFTFQLNLNIEQVAQLVIPSVILHNCEREEILSKVSEWINDWTNGAIKSIRPVDVETYQGSNELFRFDFTIEREGYKVVATTLFHEDADENEIVIGISKETIELGIIEQPS